MIRIRLGELNDLPALERIERETALMFAAEDLPEELAMPLPREDVVAGVSSSLLWVAEIEPAFDPIGFVLCERPAPACLHIREMDVRPSHGRKGVGGFLLLHACAAAKSLGLRVVTLTTFNHLPWNAPFYARHGFDVANDLASYPHLSAILERERALGLRNRIAMLKHAD